VEGEGVINGQHLEKLAAKTDSFCTLGGERRLVHWKAETMGGLRESWSFQEDIHSALDSQKNGNKRIRLVLATPAIFNQGWLPGWLKFSGESIEGVHKEIMPSGIKLKLVSACIGRWKPISGWSLEKSSRGPKKIRRLVPSGSIYFFEVVEGDAKVLVKNLWMRSVCDEKQDRLDGFGLALWGVWDFLE
jgi:CRISPR-associated protein Cmr3